MSQRGKPQERLVGRGASHTSVAQQSSRGETKRFEQLAMIWPKKNEALPELRR